MEIEQYERQQQQHNLSVHDLSTDDDGNVGQRPSNDEAVYTESNDDNDDESDDEHQPTGMRYIYVTSVYLIF